MKKLIILLCIMIIPFICIGDSTRICVGYTHALSIDVDHGGVLVYEKGKIILDEHLWRLQLWAAGNGGANYYRILPESPFINVAKSKVLTRFYYNKERKKYDLWKWNDNYWKITKRMQEIAWNEYGLRFYCELFDHCQQYPHIEPANNTSPFRGWNNVQEINTYQDSNTLTRRIVKKSLEVYKLNRVAYSLGNEIRFIKKNITSWAMVIFKELLEANVNPNRIAYGCCGFNNYHSVLLGKDTFIEIKDDQYNFFVQLKSAFTIAAGSKEFRRFLIRPIHQSMDQIKGFIPVNPWAKKLGKKLFYALNYWGNFPNRICSDDGTQYTGKGKLWIEPGTNREYRRPSVEQWFETVVFLLENKFVGGFEHLPLDRWDYAYTTKVFKAISEGYKKHYGKYPSNYNKYKRPVKIVIPVPDPVIPDPIIEDPIEPVPDPEPKGKNSPTFGMVMGGMMLVFIILWLIFKKKKDE